jgi:hypothetical protein
MVGRTDQIAGYFACLELESGRKTAWAAEQADRISVREELRSRAILRPRLYLYRPTCEHERMQDPFVAIDAKSSNGANSGMTDRGSQAVHISIQKPGNDLERQLPSIEGSGTGVSTTSYMEQCIVGVGAGN